MYAIFKTTEKLERAYVRDAVTAKEYEPACQKLIGQYKTLWETLRDTVWHSLKLCLADNTAIFISWCNWHRCQMYSNFLLTTTCSAQWLQSA